jgi:hypothetical protein
LGSKAKRRCTKLAEAPSVRSGRCSQADGWLSPQKKPTVVPGFADHSRPFGAQILSVRVKCAEISALCYEATCRLLEKAATCRCIPKALRGKMFPGKSLKQSAATPLSVTADFEAPKAISLNRPMRFEGLISIYW